jgi:hypothetical protein
MLDNYFGLQKNNNCPNGCLKFLCGSQVVTVVPSTKMATVGGLQDEY